MVVEVVDVVELDVVMSPVFLPPVLVVTGTVVVVVVVVADVDVVVAFVVVVVLGGTVVVAPAVVGDVEDGAAVVGSDEVDVSPIDRLASAGGGGRGATSSCSLASRAFSSAISW